MHNDRDLLRNLKQEAVTYNLTMPLCNICIIESREEVWMEALNGQTAGVVIKVVLPVVKLPII